MLWLSNLFENIVFQTVMSGVFIFILSEFIKTFFLEPLQKYKEIIGEIDSNLIFYKNILATPIQNEELNRDCRKAMKYLMSQLGAIYNKILFKNILILIQRISSLEQIHESVRKLRSLSNNIGKVKLQNSGKENIKALKIIRRNLKIKDYEF